MMTTAQCWPGKGLCLSLYYRMGRRVHSQPVTYSEDHEQPFTLICDTDLGLMGKAGGQSTALALKEEWAGCSPPLCHTAKPKAPTSDGEAVPHPPAAAVRRGPVRSPPWPPARRGCCACAWPAWKSGGRSSHSYCRCRVCSVCGQRGACRGWSTP